MEITLIGVLFTEVTLLEILSLGFKRSFFAIHFRMCPTDWKLDFVSCDEFVTDCSGSC